MINPVEEIVFRLSRRALLRGQTQSSTYPTISDYARWRDSGLRALFTAYFDASKLYGRRVVDFGCGTGDLSRFAHAQRAASVTGVDLSERMIAVARDSAARHGVADKISFVLGRPEEIPLDDASADVVLCFDVMEHIIEYRSIIPEWRRILVRGGRVLISWELWMHPYGHHSYPLVNVPWAHLFLTDAALMRICARTFELDEYRPSFWHLDENRNKKEDNPYINATSLSGYLNKLTTRKFERICCRSGLQIQRKSLVPFSGDRLRHLKNILVSVPFVSDALCACAIYELEAV
jgi:SAM-dependent methyltransferase